MPEDGIKVTVDSKRLQEAMRKAPQRLYAGLRDAFAGHYKSFFERFKIENLRAGKSGRGVQTRSGRLRDSFFREVRGDSLGTIEAEAYSAGNPYARIQEEGDTITPKKGQYLTIPLDAARQGDRRGAITRASARNFANTFFLETRAGKLLIMQKQGAGNIVPLFLLVESVTLKPRLGFRKLWDKMLPSFFRKIDGAVDAALAGGPA